MLHPIVTLISQLRFRRDGQMDKSGAHYREGRASIYTHSITRSKTYCSDYQQIILLSILHTSPPNILMALLMPFYACKKQMRVKQDWTDTKHFNWILNTQRAYVLLHTKVLASCLSSNIYQYCNHTDQLWSVASWCVILIPVSHLHTLTVHSFLSNYMFQLNVAIIRFTYTFKFIAPGQSHIHSLMLSWCCLN
jgi:hypothetical protein